MKYSVNAITPSKPLKTFEGPALAAILLASQLLGHIFMNSNPSESNFKMFISHILAFGLTYQFANKLDDFEQSQRQLRADERPIMDHMPEPPQGVLGRVAS